MIIHLINQIKKDNFTKFTYIIISNGIIIDNSLLITLVFMNKIHVTIKRQMTQLVTPIYKFNLTQHYIKILEKIGTSIYGVEWKSIFYMVNK
jgi:hypothetical protein